MPPNIFEILPKHSESAQNIQNPDKMSRFQMSVSNQTYYKHLNTGLVWYTDPHCTENITNKVMVLVVVDIVVIGFEPQCLLCWP